MLNRGDIYGDGVNVAARLEALADPAGICVSESVRTAVGNRLNLGYDDIGKQEVIFHCFTVVWQTFCFTWDARKTGSKPQRERFA